MISFRDIDGTKMAAWVNTDDFANGRKSVVFIHGSGGDHTNWIYQYSQLKDDFNIAALELPGHGRSEGKGEQSVDRYVDWVMKAVEAFSLAKPILVGHSLGAAISLTAAIRFGEKLSGIVPVGGGVKMPVNPAILEGLQTDPAAVLAMVVKFSFTKENRERFGRTILEGMSRVNAAVTYGDLLSCDRLDLTETLSQIRVPTLVICGKEDKMTPPAGSEALRDRIPGARLSLIEGAGHFVMMEQAEAFNGALKGFVQALP